MPGAVYDALAAGLTGPAGARTLDLYAAARDQAALAPLQGVLALFGIADSYMVRAAVLAQPGPVVLAGTATFGIPGADPANVSNVDVRLVVDAPDGPSPRFELTLSIRDSGWTFSTTFPVLPDGPVERNGAVSYVPSFLVGLPLGGPRFSASSDPGATLVLAGALYPDGALEAYGDLFGPWPLTLLGSVILPTAPDHAPQLSLTAIAPALSLRVGDASVRDVGLGMQVLTGLSQDDSPFPELSQLLMVGTVSVGTVDPIVARLSAVLLSPGSDWRLMVDFAPGALTLSRGLGQIASFLGVRADQLVAPDGFGDFGGFYLSELEFAVTAPSGGIFPAPTYAAATVRSDREWHPPIPFVLVRDVAMQWMVRWDEPGNLLSAELWGGVGGTLVIGEGAPPPSQSQPLLGPPTLPPLPENDGGDGGGGGEGDGGGDEAPATSFRVDTMAELPSFALRGALRDGDSIPIGYAFRTFFGDPGPPTPEDMEVTSFSFSADPLALTLDASATITTGWTVPLGGGLALELTELSFEIGVTQSAVTGAIAGTVELDGVTREGDTPATFVLRAEYRGSGSGEGWIFTGEMYPDSYLDLVQTAVSFLGLGDAPSGVPSLDIQDVFLSFTTGTGAYALRGTVVGRWTPVVFGQQLALSVAAGADLASPDGGAPGGRLTGTFAVNRLALTVGIDVGVDDPTYEFRVQFGELWLDATTGWRGEGTARHQVLSVQLGGTTVGAILEYLVSLAAPTLGYTLDAPWSVLNQVELSRFLLTVDPTESTVELTYRVGLDLVFMQVETVGVRYRRVDGEGAVEMILTGRMLDRTYDAARPLSWDVIRDPPPAVPGQGGALVDLRYLGLGQRVTLRGIEQMWTVAEVLAALKAQMQPPAVPRANPLEQPQGSAMLFAPESQWLIGLDLGLLEGTVDLGFVFNDPRLYGLSIGLNGERAGPLAGLRFEILYKKVSDDVGVFRVELRLPEAFRHFEFGEVSLTLGVVSVEVYTNGNFMVDLGFPYDRDFSRAFTVEVFPYIGRGGIYFGVLNGTTSSRVPAITNGTFSPVLELGVGLAIGVGKDVTVGPMSGGMFVEVEVLFQGVLAWFNPTSSGSPSSVYYWAQGIAAIHGRVYGQVDFKVIKVAVSVEAYAQASVVLEAGRATIFGLKVAADARATVRIAFVDVDFSYHLELDASFSVGSDRATPWLLAGGGSSTHPSTRQVRGTAAVRVPERRTRALAATHARSARSLAATRDVGSGDDLLSWSPLGSVFADGPRPVAVTMLPAFGVTDVPLRWDGGTPGDASDANRVALLLFAGTGAGDAAETLIEGFLRWSLRAVTGEAGGPGASVTIGQLRVLAEGMQRPATVEAGFSTANLAAFFAASLPLRIAGDPGGAPAPRGGMAFPVPPALAWTSPQAGGYDFAADTPVGPLYEWGAARYAASLFPLPTPSVDPPADDPEAYEPFAAFVFRDWCLMVARAAVQAARDAMEGWTYDVASAVSLADVADSFPVVTVDYAVRAGDTVASVADALGATAEELAYLNDDLPAALADAEAGQSLPIALGVSPVAVGLDNAAVPLAIGIALPLGRIDTLAGQGDTLAGIAARFGIEGAAALFAGTALADELLLLLPGAPFATTDAVWQPPAGWSTTLSAAVLYVHFYGGLAVPEASWYAQTVFTLNQDGTLAGVDFDAPVPPGTPLRVPAAYGNTAAGPDAYTAVAGDTLARIGAALALAQVWGASADAPEPGWPAFRDAVTPVTGGVRVPASTVRVFPGETVRMLADRTLVHAGDVAGLLPWIEDAPVLRPLAAVAVPSVTATTAAGDTLAELARRYGLTVADLAGRIADVPGLFPVDEETPARLTIAHLPAQSVDAVVAAVLAGGAPAQVAGTSSRWMLSGLRLPSPLDRDGHAVAEGALAALYDLSGQQFAGPAPDLENPDDVGLAVTVTLSGRVPGAAEWIQFVSSTVEGGDIVLADAVGALDFAYTNAELADAYPAGALAVEPIELAPLPLAGVSPRTYGLDHRIVIQSPVPLPVPTVGDAPLAGACSLWPFPADFRARARRGTDTPYELVAALPEDDSGATATVVEATWAALLPFGVRMLDGVDRTYGLRGADTASRQVLLAAWQYLATEAAAGTSAFLLVAPSPDARNLTGLNVLALDAASTFLVQSNLSTETAPGVRSTRGVELDVDDGAAPTAGPYFASFADLDAFARLLWEGSVVGGTGYHLGLRTADGSGIPASAFDADGNATLHLLLVAGEQQAPRVDGRPLLGFENCALVGPGLDAAASSLFAEAADGSEPVARAVVPPGNAGFTLTLPQPLAGEEDADARLRRLFSLVTWQVEAGATFTASLPGLPVPPQAQDGDREEPSLAARRARQARASHDVWTRQARAAGATDPIGSMDGIRSADAVGSMETAAGAMDTADVSPERDAPDPVADARWRYEQVIPLYRLGPVSASPAVPGLPDPAEDPYRGIGADTLEFATIRLGLADIVGNVSGEGTAGVEAPVGYTDPLLGVSGWPAVTPSFAVSADDGRLTLSVTVAPQPGAVAPSPVESIASSTERASRQADTYRRASYQLAQPGVTAALLTTLKQGEDGDPLPLAVDGAPLWRFAASGWLAARGAASLAPVRPAAENGISLGDVMGEWGVSAAALASANADQPAVLLFGDASPVVPAYAVFAAGDTASALAADARPGWPVTTGTALLADGANAAELPLRAGAILVIPPTQYVLEPGPTPPLDAVAADAHTTAALLATDNATAEVLADGFVFEMGGIAVTANVTALLSGTIATTFELVRQAFAEVGIHATAGDIAAANADRPEMLAPGATLTLRRYVAYDGDTLAANASGASVADLAALNAETADLYDAGALLYLGDFDASVTRPLDATETLRQLAARFACPVEQVLAASASLVLPAGSTLSIPGAGTLDPAVYVPCTVTGEDTLDAIAARFAPAPGAGSAAENLAAANEAMPGTLAAGITLSVPVTGGTVSTVTVAGDSFASVLDRLRAEDGTVTLAGLVDAIAATPGTLATGALLVCPPARIPAGTDGGPLSLAQLEAAYGVDATAFALANAGVAGLIAFSEGLFAADGHAGIRTGAHDTFNTLLSRFAVAGEEMGLSDIVAANMDVPLLIPQALALLPPTPVVVTAELGTAPGPFAAPAFPLRTGIRVQRPAAVISSAFATDGGGPVERADSAVPAPQRGTGPEAAEGTLTFDAFVAAFEAALPTLRLATGRVEGTDGDLWVVDFGPGGVASVSIAPGVPVAGEVWPRFFGLRPLYADLVSRQAVPFPTLNPDGTLAEESTPIDFQGVDVEVWARRFLADLDLFLTAPYAGAAYRDADARGALQRLLDAKRTLGDAVSRGLAAVLEVEDAREVDGLAEAARLLGQELDVSLSRAYEVSAVLQYDAAVSSAWTAPGNDLRPARLSGTPTVADPGDDGSADRRPFTLTGAKVALDEANPFVTLLMRVSDPAHHGRVAVDLDLSVLDLEFGITAVPGVAGYEASDWLAFVPPLAGEAMPAALRTSLGAATVPVPLRAYPAFPVLLGHAAEPTSSTPTTLEEAAEWTYSLTYSHEHAEQDEVLVQALFNLSPTSPRLARDVSLDVASALARYVAVADPLWELLGGFADPARGVADEVLSNAAASFAALADPVALAWESHWPSLPSPREVRSAADGVIEAPVEPVAPARDTYRYSVRLADRAGEDGQMLLDTLTLVAVEGGEGPGGAWPELAVRAPDSTTVDLVPREATGSVRIYEVPDGVSVPATTWPVLTMRWPRLPVAAYQNASADLSVRRNQRLLGPDGPPTSAGFVYQTPAVTATDMVVPLNAWTDPIDITPLGDNVETALQAAFDQLFGGTVGQPVTVGMFFGYELVPGTSLVTYLPVGLYPNQTLGPDTAGEIAGALEAWRQASQPAAANAEWALSLTAFSQVAGDARRPLLTLDRLVFRMTP